MRRKWEIVLIIFLTIFVIFDFMTRYRDYIECKMMEEIARSKGDYDEAEFYHEMASSRIKGFYVTLLIYFGIIASIEFSFRTKERGKDKVGT